MLKRPHFALSPSRAFVAREAGFMSVGVWPTSESAEEPPVIIELGGVGPAGIGFLDDRVVVTLCRDGILEAWNIEAAIDWTPPPVLEPAQQEPAEQEPAEQSAESDAPDTEGETLAPDPAATAGADRPTPTRLWSTRIGRDVSTWSFHHGPRGSRACAGHANGALSFVVFDGSEAPRVAGFAGHRDSVLACAFDVSGQRFASSGRDRAVRIWSADAPWTTGSTADGPVFGFDGDGRPATPSPLAAPPEQSGDDVVATADTAGSDEPSPDSDTTAPDEDAREVPEATPQPVPPPSEGVSPLAQNLAAPDGWIVALSFSPDGRHLAGGGMDHGLYCWALAQATAPRTQFAHAGWVVDVAWSTDGATLATASWDTSVGLFTAANLEPQVRLELHKDYVTDVEFFGARLLSAGQDSIVAVWRSDGADLEGVLQGHGDWVESIEPLPDGGLLSVSSDGTMRTWSLDSKQETARFGRATGLGVVIGAPVDFGEYVDTPTGLGYDRQEEASRSQYRDYRAGGFRSSNAATAIALLENAIGAAEQQPAGAGQLSASEPPTIATAGHDAADAFVARAVAQAPVEMSPAPSPILSESPHAEPDPAAAPKAQHPAEPEPALESTAPTRPAEPEAATFAPEPVSASEAAQPEPAVEPEPVPANEATERGPAVEPEPRPATAAAPGGAAEPEAKSTPTPAEEPPMGLGPVPSDTWTTRQHQAPSELLVEARPTLEVEAIPDGPEPGHAPPTAARTAAPPERRPSKELGAVPKAAVTRRAEVRTPIVPYSEDTATTQPHRPITRPDQQTTPVLSGAPDGDAQPTVEVELSDLQALAQDAAEPPREVRPRTLRNVGPYTDDDDADDGGFVPVTAVAPQNVVRRAIDEIQNAANDSTATRLETLEPPRTFEPEPSPPSVELPGDLSLGDELSVSKVDDAWDALEHAVDNTAFEADDNRLSAFDRPAAIDDVPSTEWEIDAAEARGLDNMISTARESQAALPKVSRTVDVAASELWAARPSREQRGDTGRRTEKLPAVVPSPRYEQYHAIRTMHGHVYGIAVAPSGLEVATCGADDTICVWSLEGDLRHRIQAENDGFNTIQFSNDGQALAAAGDDGKVHLWLLPQPGTRELKHATMVGHASFVSDLQFARDGSFILSASYDGTVRVWKLQTGDCVRVLEGHADAVTAVGLDPSRAYSAGRDGTVAVWNQAWHRVDLLEGYDSISALAKSSGVLAFGTKNGDVFVARRDGRPTALMRHRGEARAVVITEDGAVFSAGTDGTVRLYAPEADSPTQMIRLGVPIWRLAQARQVIAAAGDDGFAYILRPKE